MQTIMSCGCENKKAMSELSRVSELARKAAVMEQAIMAVYRKSDGSYTFGQYSTDEVHGTIVELRHYL